MVTSRTSSLCKINAIASKLKPKIDQNRPGHFFVKHPVYNKKERHVIEPICHGHPSQINASSSRWESFTLIKPTCPDNGRPPLYCAVFIFFIAGFFFPQMGSYFNKLPKYSPLSCSGLQKWRLDRWSKNTHRWLASLHNSAFAPLFWFVESFLRASIQTEECCTRSSATGSDVRRCKPIAIHPSHVGSVTLRHGILQIKPDKCDMQINFPLSFASLVFCCRPGRLV